MLTPSYSTTYDLNNYSNSDFNILKSNNHALIAVSPFNSYFSIKNMEKLFFWVNENFIDFNVFLMDEVSCYNLMAVGYSDKEAIKKTGRNDRNLYNKVIKSLNSSLGLSQEKCIEKVLLLSTISRGEKYIIIYNKYLKFFEENIYFKNDCLKITKKMLSQKIESVSSKSLHLAVKYLLAELPFWFDTPYILNLKSSVVIYKDLSQLWRKICYDYDLMSHNQSILIKNVNEIKINTFD